MRQSTICFVALLAAVVVLVVFGHGEVVGQAVMAVASFALIVMAVLLALMA